MMDVIDSTVFERHRFERQLERSCGEGIAGSIKGHLTPPRILQAALISYLGESYPLRWERLEGTLSMYGIDTSRGIAQVPTAEQISEIHTREAENLILEWNEEGILPLLVEFMYESIQNRIIENKLAGDNSDALNGLHDIYRGLYWDEQAYGGRR